MSKKDLNDVFKEVYEQGFEELIFGNNPWLTYACPLTFSTKYGYGVWKTLTNTEQSLVINQGMGAWEKQKEYKQDFDKLIND